MGPEVKPIGSVDELRGDPQFGVRPAHAALQDRTHSQLRTDGPDVLGRVFERERGRTRRHAQRGNGAQRVQDLLRHAVAEIPVLRIGAEIHERQHSDRVLRSWRRFHASRGRFRYRGWAGAAQCGDELRDPGKPIHRRVRERARHRLLEPLGDRVPECAEVWQGLEHLPGQNCLHRAREERVPREHFEQHAPEAVEIAAAVELVDPPRLLRAHVSWGADRDARSCHPTLVRHADGAGDAEVAHHRMAGLEKDVLRLDVAMHDVPAVSVGQGVRHLARDAQRLLERELPLADQAIAQRLPHVRHHVIQETAGLPGVVQWQDVRMGEPGGEVDLT